MLKKIFRPLINSFIHLFFKDLRIEEFGTIKMLYCVFWQKILRINGQATWPVHFTSQVLRPDKIIPGNMIPGFSIGCFLDGRNGIVIEENVWIGPRVSLISQNHDNVNYNLYLDSKPIIIRKNSLLTSNCVILPGVELGEHTVVAAGAVVTKSFIEGNQLLGGVPAKIIKKLPPYSSDKKNN